MSAPLTVVASRSEPAGDVVTGAAPDVLVAVAVVAALVLASVAVTVALLARRAVRRASGEPRLGGSRPAAVPAAGPGGAAGPWDHAEPAERPRGDLRHGDPGHGGQLPAPVLSVLSALGRPLVVVRRDLAVVHSTPEARRIGLVRGRDLAHTALRELAREALPEPGGPAGRHHHEATLSLARGPVGAGLLHVHARSVAIDDEHVVLDVVDRSETVRVEQVRRDFVANVSHELKTPVGALALLAETIGDAADDPGTVRRFAERIRVESVRLASLVQEIMELSRVQAVGGLDTAEPVELDEVVAEALEQSGCLAEAKAIALTVGGERGAVVVGDRDLLVRAVRNLLDNAVAYSPERTNVGVGVRRSDGIVELRIADHGYGIPVSEQGRVFERFYRGDPARSRDTGGTGLGLAIVKHVVENHGGEVTLWSRPGHGSTFTVRLPEAVGLVPAGTTTGSEARSGAGAGAAARPATMAERSA